MRAEAPRTRFQARLSGNSECRTDQLGERGVGVTNGIYERIVQAALEAKHASPWETADLDEIDSTITPEVCSRFSEKCDAAAVRDWLKALPSEEREDLLHLLNSPVASGEAKES